jgi:ribonuclease P protein component
MFPVVIKKRSKFIEVSRFGTRARTENLISACYKEKGSVAYVGYVVSKKVGNAVKRNKVKRRLKSLVREMGLSPGYAFVIIATPKIVNCDFAVLRSDFRYCINRSKEKAEYNA